MFCKKTAAEALFLRLGEGSSSPASGPAAPWAFIYSSKLENFCAGGRRLISWMLSSTSGAALWRRTASSRRVRGWGFGSFFLSALAGPALAPQGRGASQAPQPEPQRPFCRGYACARRGGAGVWPGPRFAGRPAALFLFLPWLFSPVLFFARPARPACHAQVCQTVQARRGRAQVWCVLSVFQYRQGTQVRPRSKS